MDPILFYGVPQGCSFGSIVVLEWLGRPYRLCRIVMPEDAQGKLFGRVNTLRETPSLMLEDGSIFSQSSAILLNLARRDPARLGDPADDRLTEMLSYLTTSFFAAFSPLWGAFEMAENPPIQTMLRARGHDGVTKAFAEIEARLADRAWLAGEHRTVADAYFIGVAHWNDFHKVIDLAAYPRVAALIARLEADPAVVFAHAIEDGEAVTGTGGFKGHVALDELAPRLAA